MFALPDKKYSAAPFGSASKNVQRKAGLSPMPLFRSLPRSIGNQGMASSFGSARPAGSTPPIQRQCQCGGTCSGCGAKSNEVQSIQTPLTVGPVNDPYEREADRVADSVMRMPTASIQAGTRGMAASIQRIGGESNVGFDPGPGFKTAQGGGQAISEATRQYMEPRFGVDFSAVRVHTGAEAEQSASQIQARAYTQGNHITLGKGASEGDRGLMAHELTHVVQQGGAEGKVQRTPIPPRIQRDPPPAANPCPGGVRQIDIFAVNLPGSTRSIYDDEAIANRVLAQCCARINIVGGQSWDTTLLDTDAPHGVLNAPSGTVRPLTAEENAMLAHQPGGASVVHAYYVPSFSGPKVAEAFWPAQHGERAFAISNRPNADSFPHELMHVLLNNGNHHADPDNLMASGGSRNVGVDNLEPAQCAAI